MKEEGSAISATYNVVAGVTDNVMSLWPGGFRRQGVTERKHPPDVVALALAQADAVRVRIVTDEYPSVELIRRRRRRAEQGNRRDAILEYAH
jgi:hypothetical protein